MSDQERIVSTEPSREHVEAVAGIAADHIGDAKDPADPHSWRCYDKVRYPGDCGCTWALANDFLTSTDPAVLDAMQDALVRAGRLKEQPVEWGVRRPAPFSGVIPAMSHGEAERSRDIVAECGGDWPKGWAVVTRRRFVTEWQEDQP